VISILRGIVASVGLDHIDVVVGGIGFRVHVTPAFAQGNARDEEITVYTSMIVREDSMTLYGFESCDERDVFTTLMSVSGIGPKIALAALAVLRPDDLRRAVRDQDLAALQRIPGVGKKSAQRMALEIGDKLGTPAAVRERMYATRAIDGTQSEEWGSYKATWTYEPDQGLTVIISSR